MTKRRLIVGVACISLLACLPSCVYRESDSFTAIREDRAQLIPPFESYFSVQNVQETLSHSGYAWEVVEDNRTVAQGEARPPFHIHSIGVNDYPSMGYKGRLVLQFFNNRLLSTAFYPDSPDEYKTRLQTTYSLQLGSEVDLDSKTKLRMALDYKMQFFVEWEDIRLGDELQRWIARYA